MAKIWSWFNEVVQLISSLIDTKVTLSLRFASIKNLFSTLRSQNLKLSISLNTIIFCSILVNISVLSVQLKETHTSVGVPVQIIRILCSYHDEHTIGFPAMSHTMNHSNTRALPLVTHVSSWSRDSEDSHAMEIFMLNHLGHAILLN